MIFILKNAALRLISSILLLVMAACSGGGSGGGSAGPGFSVSPGSLTFNATAASSPTPAPQTITITVTGGTVYLGAFYDGAAIDYATFTITGQTTAEVRVYPASPSSLGIGTHSGTVRIVGCNDVYCNSQVAGSPRDVGVTYNITELSASPTSVSFDALFNTTPAPVSVNISSSSGSAAWSSSISYSGTSGWLMLTPTSGTSLPATISFSASALPTPGTYFANVLIASGNQSRSIPVTYVVHGSVSPSPTSISYAIGNAPTAGDLSRQISTNAYSGVTWTAVSSVSWLSLSPTSGGSGGSITASLVTSELDTMPNGTYSGTVTITPSVGSVATVPVTLTINRPAIRVNYVAPYVAISNTSREVIVRGENLNQSGVLSVKFGNTNAVAFTVLSATEIRATHPALAAGSYEVRLENAFGLLSQTQASLVVRDAPAYPAAAIPYPNATVKTPMKVIYDAERGAIVVAVAYSAGGSTAMSDGEIFRYAYTGTAWPTVPASLPVTAFRDLDLSIDGQQLLALTDYSITQVDPESLTTGTVTNVYSDPLFYYLRSLATANDGYSIVTTGLSGSGSTPIYLYAARSPAVSNVGTYPTNLKYFGTPGASADGSRIVIAEGGGLSPPPYVGQYTAATGTLSMTSLALNQNYQIPPTLNRNASRLILNGYLVYDANYALLGNLPLTGNPTSAISPDGTRAYRHAGGTLLRTYDLTATPIGGVFPEIGTGTTLAGDPGTNARLTVSPDGGTIFVAGSAGIMVQPAP